MSLYCFIGYDAPGSTEKRNEHLDNHIKYLSALKQKGKLLAAGPLMTSEEANAAACGSMMIIDFENREVAQKWLASDPFALAGVWNKIEVFPYIECVPNL